MKNKAKLILAILLMMAVCMAGCRNNNEGTDGNTDGEIGNIETGGKIDGVQGGTTDVDVDEEYTYRDIIYDRSLTEGKMACYFFRSNYLRPKPSGVTTSGDSTLLIAPDGTTMLIDVNLTSITGRVVDYLQHLGIKKLDYLMLSHADIDHYGGYEALFNYIEVGHLLISESPDYMNIANKAGRCVAKAVELGIPYTTLHAGMTLDFGGVHMDTLWPTADYQWETEDGSSAALINGGSLVVRFTYKDASFLFAGDLYVAQENIIVDTYGDAIQSDIVKMSHHGLKTSNGDKWIVTTNPKLLCGMVSTMKEEEILLQYMYYEIPFTYSIFDGTTVVYTSGDGVYDVQVERDRDNNYFGSLNTVNGHFQIK